MRKIFLVALVLFLPIPCLAAEVFTCIHVADDEKGHSVVKQDAKADFYIDEANTLILPRVTLPVASKEVTFKGCRVIPKTSANFSKWFQFDCPKMKGADGKSYAVDAYFYGSYAAISPSITPDYSMWKTLSKVSKDAGLPTPERTFVIYTAKSPSFEFFCHHDPNFKDNGQIPQRYNELRSAPDPDEDIPGANNLL